MDGEAHRQRWLRRTWQLHFFVLISHLYAFLLLVGFCIVGYIPETVLGAYGLWVGGGMGFITWAYASGWCHKRRDPGLFVVHQAVSIVGALGLLVAAPQVAFQALVMLIAFSADGFLARSRMSFAVTWALTLLAVSGAIFWVGPYMRMPTDALPGQLLTVGVVLGGVARCVLLVTFFRGMQYRLSVANDKLGAALAQIETLVRSDELTGVANRRGIMESLHRQRELLDRSQQPFCVALLDIDHFKRVNDRHGHAAGDRVLRTFGALLASCTRAVDRIGRYGGEEFLLVMPDTNAEQAVDALERLRLQIVGANWTALTGIPSGMTATIGVTQYRAGESVEATIRRADEALYRGKAAGRNRVVVEPMR